MSPIQFSIFQAEDGSSAVAVFANGELHQAAADHPNFATIVGACTEALQGAAIDQDKVVDLFNVPATIEREFQRLGERVTVKGDTILFDGDPIVGPLQDQILSFLDAGADFEPLVKFWEKLATNPLGDVRAGLFSWIQGQTANGGALTITPEGDVLGYKSTHSQAPEWREGVETVYVPSRRGEGVVNGRDVSRQEYIEQVPGDVVEMPRSRVLHAPSQACGDGLHIGTFTYADGFQGDTVLLVKFNPRDIVSLPDSNSTWKLRVCRYTVVDTVDEPLTVPVYQAQADEPQPESDSDAFVLDVNGNEIVAGSRVKDWSGDLATVDAVDPDDGMIDYTYDNRSFGDNGRMIRVPVDHDFVVVDESDDLDVSLDATPGGDFAVGDLIRDEDGDEGVVIATEDEDGDLLVDFSGNDGGSGFDGESYAEASKAINLTRIHGKGGPTSYATKGTGRNPHQDEAGKFSSGRPGSSRDSGTGRFV